jgi:hypothetical protein
MSNESTPETNDDLAKLADQAIELIKLLKNPAVQKGFKKHLEETPLGKALKELSKITITEEQRTNLEKLRSSVNSQHQK